MRHLSGYLGALCLCACQIQDPSTPADNETVAAPANCPAAEFQGLIGETASAADVIPAPKRVIGPDDAVTMDYRPERTNVDLDAAGRIIRIRCG